MATVAFATYHELPLLTNEEQLVCTQLRQWGIQAQPAVWHDTEVRWQDFDAVIVRSCWDYHYQPDAFIRWIEHIDHLGIPLWNPATLIRWNINKVYLRDLQQRGVSIVPTVWLDGGSIANLAQLLDQQGWSEAVVKPAISATAFDTWRISANDALNDQPRFAALLRRCAVLVQPYLEAISSEGEWSLIFIANTYSHAVLKRPRSGDFRVQSDFGGVVDAVAPPAALLAQAEHVLATITDPWLYARVDGVLIDGRLQLMELEMIEPGLFLRYAPHAIECFAHAIAERLHNQVQRNIEI